MDMSPKTMRTASATGWVNIGALVSGIYQGVAHAHGTQIDPNTLAAIKYGPVALNFFIGIPFGKRLANDDRYKNDAFASYKEKGGNLEAVSGCLPVMTPVMSAAFTVGAEYLGYFIGNAIGHGTK